MTKTKPHLYKFNSDVLKRIRQHSLEEETSCILECFYDKEIKACGSCLRTLEEIAEAGRNRKCQEAKEKEEYD